MDEVKCCLTIGDGVEFGCDVAVREGLFNGANITRVIFYQ